MTDDVITVRRDDVEQILDGHTVADYEGLPRASEAFCRLSDAVKEPDGPESPLPDGEYARVEIMGHDFHTGWVTESTRTGPPVMVVRNWDGFVIAEVPGHSLYRFIPLPTPLKRPDPQVALPVGAGFGYEYDGDPDPF
jgi:hypothetical protein